MEKRFTIVKNFGGMRFIKDRKDNTTVATIHGYGREPEKTEAMMNVMLDALNNTVSHYNPQPDDAA